MEKEEAYTHNGAYGERCQTMIEPLLSDQWFVKMEELAKKYKTLLVRDTIGGILGNEALMHDPIHPNQEGQEVIAARILRIMKPVVEHME